MGARLAGVFFGTSRIKDALTAEDAEDAEERQEVMIG